MVASPPPSSSSLLAGRAAAPDSRGNQQSTSGTDAARARSMGDVERTIMQEMPSVVTKGLPNGNMLEGFLYKYRKGEQVQIVCICHGSFHTPAGFVEHAGRRGLATLQTCCGTLSSPRSRTCEPSLTDPCKCKCSAVSAFSLSSEIRVDVIDRLCSVVQC